MKKWTALLLAAVLCMSFTACGKLSEREQLAVDTVNRYMTEKGNEMVATYEEDMGLEARDVTVTHVLDYVLEDWEMYDFVHCLMIRLAMDAVTRDENGEGAVYYYMCIVLDMETGEIYDLTMPVQSNGEVPVYDTVDTLMPCLVSAFDSAIMFDDPVVWSSAAQHDYFTAKELKSINKAIG